MLLQIVIKFYEERLNWYEDDKRERQMLNLKT